MLIILSRFHCEEAYLNLFGVDLYNGVSIGIAELVYAKFQTWSPCKNWL